MHRTEDTVTQQELKEQFDYDKELGRLVKKQTGHVMKSFIVKYKNKQYRQYRLVFLYHHGYLPDGIEFADRDKTNWHTENLIDLPERNFRQNCRLNKNNTSGVTGVYLYKNIWHAEIQVKKQTNIAKCISFRAAVKARREMELKHGWTKGTPAALKLKEWRM